MSKMNREGSRNNIKLRKNYNYNKANAQPVLE
jgi:hypothetical protein